MCIDGWRFWKDIVYTNTALVDWTNVMMRRTQLPTNDLTETGKWSFSQHIWWNYINLWLLIPRYIYFHTTLHLFIHLLEIIDGDASLKLHGQTIAVNVPAGGRVLLMEMFLNCLLWQHLSVAFVQSDLFWFIYSYTDGGGCPARWQTAHQEQFVMQTRGIKPATFR